MSPSNYETLNKILQENFGSQMCPPPDAENPLSTMTLKKFSTIGCNVVIFYASSQKPKNAWSQSFVSSPWGNVQTTEQMLTVSDSSCTKCTGRVLHLYVSTIVDTIDYSIILANYKSLNLVKIPSNFSFWTKIWTMDGLRKKSIFLKDC